tara:strand:+ start:295 stop:1782 length:1488 start_codon:yes stop_codon:yes gene_type:complete
MENNKFEIEKKVNKGINFFEKNKYFEAIQIFNELKDNISTKVIGIFFLGVIELKRDNFETAKKFFYRVLDIDKDHVDANLNLGLVHIQEKDHEKSLIYFKKVLTINKENLNALYHTGLSYFSLRNYKESIKYLNLSIKVNKKFIHSYVTLGHIYLRTKKFEKALDNYKKVLELDPKRIKTKFNISWCYFAKSNLDLAFENYEFREEKIIKKGRHKEILDKFNSIEWNGQNLENKKILIICEQGNGDNINFFRYLFWLHEKFNTEIFFYVYKKLEYLFINTPFKIISNLKNVNHIDYHQHLLSLPGIFYKQRKGFQRNINYIKINETVSSKWKKKLNSYKKPIIAINWQGDQRYGYDDMRSIPLSYFKNILNNKNFEFLSLQKNFGLEQIKSNNFENLLIDLSNEIDVKNNAFEDTISILKNVKCLITSDTAIAHLAGTLNIKTFLLLSFNPEWRWYVELKYKCFYPNMNIIQQRKFGDWEGVFHELNKRLELKDF